MNYRAWRTASFAAAIACTAGVAAVTSVTSVSAKGISPASHRCDVAAKPATAWTDCIAATTAAMPDDELFYAGYWLAKSGRYDEAIRFLQLARVKDERVLTYIGFATRKSGNVKRALGYYNEALALNPDYTIARSYLGEAHLSLGEPEKAKAELKQIALRCGTSCEEYTELADEISRDAATRAGRG